MLQQLYIQSYLWKWNLTASEVVLARTAKRIQYVDFRLLRLHLCYRRSCDPSFVSHPAKIQFGFSFSFWFPWEQNRMMIHERKNRNKI